MFRSSLPALLILSSLTKATKVKEVPLTVVQHNLTHLRISWKTQLKNIEPLYILINESKINPYPKKLEEGEANVKLNPCFSHRFCLGKPLRCVTTTTTYIPAGGKRCQSNQSAETESQKNNQSAETETVLEPQKNVSAIIILLAGFGLGLGLVGFILVIILAFSKRRRSRKETQEKGDRVKGTSLL